MPIEYNVAVAFVDGVLFGISDPSARLSRLDEVFGTDDKFQSIVEQNAPYIGGAWDQDNYASDLRSAVDGRTTENHELAMANKPQYAMQALNDDRSFALNAGYAFSAPAEQSYGLIENDDWETIVISSDDCVHSLFVGLRMIDDSECAVFVLDDGNGPKRYLAQTAVFCRV